MIAHARKVAWAGKSTAGFYSAVTVFDRQLRQRHDILSPHQALQNRASVYLLPSSLKLYGAEGGENLRPSLSSVIVLRFLASVGLQISGALYLFIEIAYRLIWPIPSALSESTRNRSLSMAVWRLPCEPLPSLEG